MCRTKAYCLPDRSVVICNPNVRLCWTKLKMNLRTSSCLVVKHTRLRAFAQVLSTWASDWACPQSLHCGEDSFFHLQRFTLCGSMPVTAFESKLEDPLCEIEESCGLVLGDGSLVRYLSQYSYHSTPIRTPVLVSKWRANRDWRPL